MSVIGSAFAFGFLGASCGGDQNGVTSGSRDGLAQKDMQRMSQLYDGITSSVRSFTNKIEFCQKFISLGDVSGASACMTEAVDGTESVSGQFLPGARTEVEGRLVEVGRLIDEVHPEATGACLTALDALDESNYDARSQWKSLLDAIKSSVTGQYPQGDFDPRVQSRYRADFDRVLKDCADNAAASAVPRQRDESVQPDAATSAAPRTPSRPADSAESDDTAECSGSVAGGVYGAVQATGVSCGEALAFVEKYATGPNACFEDDGQGGYRAVSPCDLDGYRCESAPDGSEGTRITCESPSARIRFASGV